MLVLLDDGVMLEGTICCFNVFPWTLDSGAAVGPAERSSAALCQDEAPASVLSVNH